MVRIAKHKIPVFLDADEKAESRPTMLAKATPEEMPGELVERLCRSVTKYCMSTTVNITTMINGW